jgi:hypothetical protein
MPSGMRIGGGDHMTLLIPQLPAAAAMPLLREIASAGAPQSEHLDRLSHPQAYTMPTGGTPLQDSLLTGLREAVLAAAREHGFPDARPPGFLAFELKIAEILAEWQPLWIDGRPSGEALRNDCWTFLTVIVLPDVAVWRWPPKEESADVKAWKGRMLGGSRNTFQRIFRRVMCLDRGADHPDRWGLIRELLEDDFSAILERPGLSSNRDIAICLGQEYLAMKQRLSQQAADVRTAVYRQATKAIRAYGVVQPLDLLTPEARRQIVHAAFQRHEQELTELKTGTPLELDDAPPPSGSSATPEPPRSPVSAGLSDPEGKASKPGFFRRLMQGG